MPWVDGLEGPGARREEEEEVVEDVAVRGREGWYFDGRAVLLVVGAVELDAPPAPPPILSLPILLVIPAAAAEEEVEVAAVDVRDAPVVVVVVASLSEGARERGMLDEED